MTKVYTITLSDAEDKALSVVALDQNEWIQNAVHERCRVAMDDIIKSEVDRLLSIGEQIPTSRDEIVLQAVVETGAERNARIEAELAQINAAKEAANAKK